MPRWDKEQRYFGTYIDDKRRIFKAYAVWSEPWDDNAAGAGWVLRDWKTDRRLTVITYPNPTELLRCLAFAPTGFSDHNDAFERTKREDRENKRYFRYVPFLPVQWINVKSSEVVA